MGAGGSVQSGAVDGAKAAAAAAEPSGNAEWIVGEGDGDMRALIVVGAKDLRAADFMGGSDPYCIVRLGEKGVPFEDKPRGRGRRSHTVRFSTNPTWKMGMCMDLSEFKEPEVSIQVFDKDDYLDGGGVLPFMELLDRDDFLGEASLDLAHFMGKTEEDAPMPPSLTKTESEGKTHYHTIQLRGKEEGNYGTVQLILGGNELTGSTVEDFVEGNQLNSDSKYFISQPHYEDLAKQGPVKSCPASVLGADGPMIVGGAPLPLSMQGVFWLTGQEDSSALMSFGGPSNDGGGMSTGVVTGDRRYSVRVSGDRTWAFATNTKPIYMAGILDLIYHFILNDDKAPTKCQIYPEARNFGVKLDSEWVLDFEAHLRTETKDDDQYPNSVVWIRPSFMFGDEIKAAQYALVQVLDGEGNKVEPAYSDFVAQQEARGDVFYHTSETDDKEDCRATCDEGETDDNQTLGNPQQPEPAAAAAAPAPAAAPVDPAAPTAAAEVEAGAPTEDTAAAASEKPTEGGAPSTAVTDEDVVPALAPAVASSELSLSELVDAIFAEEAAPYTTFMNPPEMLGGTMQVVILMVGAPKIEEGSKLEKILKKLSDDSNWRSALALFKDPAALKAAMKAVAAKVASGEKASTDFQAATMTVRDFWEPRDEFMQDIARSKCKFGELLAEWVFRVCDSVNN